MRRGIISAGTWTVDRVKAVDGWPQEEHLAMILDTDQQGGGSAHNLGVDMRRLDDSLPVEAIGLLGKDADAEFLLDRCVGAGIDTAQLHHVDTHSTSYTDVISDVRNGKRTFFHFSGTSNVLHPQHFDLAASNGRILHLGLLGVHQQMDSPCVHNGTQYPNGWVAVLQQAREHGIHSNLELVSIAADKIRDIALPCLPFLDSLIVNEYEAGALANMTTVDAEGRVDAQRCIDAAHSLMESGNMSLLVVHYPEAAIAITADRKVYQRDSFSVDPALVASAVGAGDAFAAGMLYGLHEDWGPSESLELAHAVAAASLRSINTVGSVVSVQECLNFARG